MLVKLTPGVQTESHEVDLTNISSQAFYMAFFCCKTFLGFWKRQNVFILRWVWSCEQLWLHCHILPQKNVGEIDAWGSLGIQITWPIYMCVSSLFLHENYNWRMKLAQQFATNIITEVFNLENWLKLKEFEDDDEVCQNVVVVQM